MPTEDIRQKLDLASRCSPKSRPDLWTDLLSGIFKLSGAHLPALQEALKNPRWRSAANPVAYIKTSAIRMAMKTGMTDRNDAHSRTAHIVAPEISSGRFGKFKVLAVSQIKAPDGCPDGCPTDDEGKLDFSARDETGRDSAQEFFLERVPDELLLLREYDPATGCMELGPDWEGIAERAGLDEEAYQVLLLRAKGYSRDRALNEATTEIARREIQAAWRRLDYNMASVRAAIRSEVVPEARTDGKRASSVVPPSDELTESREAKAMGPIPLNLPDWAGKRLLHSERGKTNGQPARRSSGLRT